MYVIPLIALLLLGILAVAWSPIFALIIAVPLFGLFLVYVGSTRRADETIKPPTGSANRHQDETPTGAWGEQRP